MSRPEGTRRFWVRLPAEYNTSTASVYPLLFALHGLGDTCDNFGPATGFSAFADNSTRPFIYIYPCGWPGLLGTHHYTHTHTNHIHTDMQADTHTPYPTAHLHFSTYGVRYFRRVLTPLLLLLCCLVLLRQWLECRYMLSAAY